MSIYEKTLSRLEEGLGEDGVTHEVIKNNLFDIARDAGSRPSVGRKAALSMIGTSFLQGYFAKESGMPENIMREYVRMVKDGVVE